VLGSVDQHAAQNATEGVARQHIVSNMIGCHRSVPSLVLVMAIYGVRARPEADSRHILFYLFYPGLDPRSAAGKAGALYI
jgi:hypothetical protein